MSLDGDLRDTTPVEAENDTDIPALSPDRKSMLTEMLTHILSLGNHLGFHKMNIADIQ